MNQALSSSNRIFLWSLFSLHKSSDSLSISDLTRLCKNTKLIPVHPNQDFISIQDLNSILRKSVFKHSPLKSILSFSDFEIILTEIANSVYKLTIINDKLSLLLKAISKQCEISYNIHLDHHLHPSNCLTDRVLTSEKKSHNHSLSGSTLVPKRPLKRKHNSHKDTSNKYAVCSDSAV